MAERLTGVSSLIERGVRWLKDGADYIADNLSDHKITKTPVYQRSESFLGEKVFPWLREIEELAEENLFDAEAGNRAALLYDRDPTDPLILQPWKAEEEETGRRTDHAFVDGARATLLGILSGLEINNKIEPISTSQNAGSKTDTPLVRDIPEALTSVTTSKENTKFDLTIFLVAQSTRLLKKYWELVDGYQITFSPSFINAPAYLQQHPEINCIFIHADMVTQKEEDEVFELVKRAKEQGFSRDQILIACPAYDIARAFKGFLLPGYVRMCDVDDIERIKQHLTHRPTSADGHSENVRHISLPSQFVPKEEASPVQPVSLERPTRYLRRMQLVVVGKPQTNIPELSSILQNVNPEEQESYYKAAVRLNDNVAKEAEKQRLNRIIIFYDGDFSDLTHVFRSAQSYGIQPHNILVVLSYFNRATTIVDGVYVCSERSDTVSKFASGIILDIPDIKETTEDEFHEHPSFPDESIPVRPTPDKPATKTAATLSSESTGITDGSDIMSRENGNTAVSNGYQAV